MYVQSLKQNAAVSRSPQTQRKSASKPGGPGSAFQQPSNKAPARSVSGKLHCTNCGKALGRGAAMIIESLGLNYHVDCFRVGTIDCRLVDYYTPRFLYMERDIM